MATKHVGYVKAIDNAAQLATRELRRLLDGLDLSDLNACEKALCEIYPALVQKYGTMAACAAAEFYEGERAAIMGESYRAQLAKAVERGAIETKVRYALSFLRSNGGGDDTE